MRRKEERRNGDQSGLEGTDRAVCYMKAVEEDFWSRWKSLARNTRERKNLLREVVSMADDPLRLSHNLMRQFFKDEDVDGVVSVFDVLVSHTNDGRRVTDTVENRRSKFAPNVRTYHLLVNSLIKNELYEGAIAAVERLKQHGIEPDRPLYNRLAHVHTSLKRYKQAIQVLRDSKADCPFDRYAYQLLINAHAKNDDIRAAVQVLEEMSNKKVPVSSSIYNTLIAALVKARHIQAAEVLIKDMRERGMEPNTYTLNTLVFGYSLCGDLEMASATLDSIRFRPPSTNFLLTAAPYTSMIQGYTKRGRMKEAETIFQVMLQDGVAPDSKAYAALFDVFHRNGDVVKARQVFDKILAQYESIADGRNENVIGPDLFRAMMMLYAKRDQPDEAQKILESMPKYGVEPTEWCYEVVIASRVAVGDFELAEETLSVVESLTRSEKTGPAAVSMQKSFIGENRRRNLDHALELMRQLRRVRKLAPIPRTYSSLLTHYIDHRIDGSARKALYKAERAGLAGFKTVGKAIMRSMARKGNANGIVKVIDAIEKRGGESDLSQLVIAYEENCDVEGILHVAKAPNHGVTPFLLMNSLLSAWLKRRNHREATEIERKMTTQGLSPSARNWASLLASYCRAGDEAGMWRLFEASTKEEKEWSALVIAFASANRVEEAYGMYVKADKMGFRLRQNALTILADALAARGSVDTVEKLVSLVNCNSAALSALVEAYSVAEDTQRAMTLVQNMAEDRILLKASGLSALLGQDKRSPKALQVLRGIEKLGVQLAPSALGVVVEVLAEHNLLSAARKKIAEYESAGGKLTARMCETMIAAYGRSKYFDLASALFESMPAENILRRTHTYDAMLRTVSRQRDLAKALKLFAEMDTAGVQKSRMTFEIIIGVAAMCGDEAVVNEKCTEYLATGESGGTLSTRMYNSKILCCLRQENLPSHRKRELADEMHREMREEGIEEDGDTCDLRITAALLVDDTITVDALFQEMDGYNIELNSAPFVRYAEYCAREGSIARIKSLRKQMERKGLRVSTRFYNAVIRAYGKEKEKIMDVLMEMRQSGVQPDVHTYNLLIHAEVEVGNVHAAGRHIEEMKRSGLEPNEETYGLLLRGNAIQGD